VRLDVALLLGLAISSAVSAQAQAKQDAAASITITRVPPPTVKPGPNSWGRIAGTVSGPDATLHKVVVYALGDIWYVQPFTAAPYTDIGEDGQWETDTHGGLEYAALLVKSSYKPTATRAMLPGVDDEVLAIVRAEPGVPTRTISFSGYEWTVKSSGRRVGPGPNHFSASTANVSVDEQGRLHLRITKADDRWLCAEVISRRSFGHGTYRFYVAAPVETFDPNVVLGLFTWNDDAAYAHREIDIEFSKWGNAAKPTSAQFVVQPSNRPDHLERFDSPAGLTTATCSFTWKKDAVAFRILKGHVTALADPSLVVQEWTFSGPGVPAAGGENARINLWLLGGRDPKASRETEVIITNFEFEPLP